MKIGVNWSGQRELPVLIEILEKNHVDFIEIMIDNFLNTNPDSILKILNGRRCAFHIMNSQFLHRSEIHLYEIAKLVRKLAKVLNPIYVSDHIGLFFIENQATSQMLEVNYERHFNWVSNKITLWQSMLDTSLFLENYPSVILQENYQSSFYHRLINETNCQLLFDISNAVVAEKNGNELKENWFPLLSNTRHYHIAGFEPCTIGNFFRDTHNTCIDLESEKFLEQIIQSNNIETISVERDDNFNISDWSQDIKSVSRYFHA
ncbi:hypothetical protein Xbed_00413 [Xenorhabdus beddingii]|uniref:Uncharacterized protein n=1 Tax=Xenorhabdus beddingii TaxID=40578 RepID=A0A1Y2SRA7_9GAMM|nr:DUF692 family multinuclear iron-containing protein [Xenorhabdus beddingii]OTA21663.1 hypothetical protein Xbed_00413 [Xenorhabdus beddingii]